MNQLMWPGIINALALAAAIILVFILKVLPARKGDRNLYLLTLLIYLIIHLTGGLAMLGGVMSLPVYALFSLSMVVLYGPTFYFYIRKFHDVPARGYLWHILPIEFVLWAPIELHALDIMAAPKWFYNLYFTSVLLGYFIAAVRIRGSVPLRQGRAWMKTIAIGFGGLILLYVIESVWMSIDFTSINSIVVINTTAYNVFCFVFLLITIKQVITRPQPFSGLRMAYKRKKTGEVEEELKAIVAYVVDKREYKNPALNRDVISEATGLGVHRISEIINSEFEKNFNEWVNEYRINEAKSHLRNSELSIKEICYEVGFNSKSVFNSAFRRQMKMTPSQYRLLL